TGVVSLESGPCTSFVPTATTRSRSSTSLRGLASPPKPGAGWQRPPKFRASNPRHLDRPGMATLAPRGRGAVEDTAAPVEEVMPDLTASRTRALGREQGSKGALFRLDLKGVRGLKILPGKN